MELREKRGGLLSLVCFPTDEPKRIPPRNVDCQRSKKFLLWLLRTHGCIEKLKLRCNWMTVHSCILLELTEYSRLKRLKVDCPCGDTVKRNIVTLLSRLVHLEELHVYVSQKSDILVAAISALLRNTACLTSLVFRAHSENQLSQTFIHALAANSTLEYLEILGKWDTAEPPGPFWSYVKSNELLSKLYLFGEELDHEGSLLEEALVCNYHISTLYIHKVCGGERTVNVLTRILAECISLKNLTLGDSRDEFNIISEAALNGCMNALVVNNTLEELELSYSLWHPTNWITFLAFLPNNKHLKTLEVTSSFYPDYKMYLPVLEALQQTNSPGRISFGCYMPTTVELDLLRFRAFSGVCIEGALKEKVDALQSLLTLNHLTSVVIDLRECDQQLFDCMAKYIKEKTVLRGIILFISNTAGDAPAACWEPLFESLSSNTSIRYLRIIVRGHFSYAGHLARAVGRSRSITQMFYEEYRPEWDPSGFLSPLSRELDENYNLLEVSLSNTAKMDAETTCCWFKVREVSRRNSGLVKRAGAAIQSPTLDWYAANALEKVSRRPVLLRELAEKEGRAVDEVAKMLRSRLVSVDGMNDFMRLTGVVKKAVTCAPPVDGCNFQIQDLNVDCWRLVRRYLSFDDVKRCPVAKPDDPMAE
ncbi:uncharacterized protein LOC119162424 isoform X1 [Rhipicephalus microplus]|uniref:uncharacterized protein LOC119162424 isoform X1 n=1 Tax=Rhipicephalus microplus TaxID=6941 RepID=UPI003F6B1955